VTDASGAGVPGATVEVTGPALPRGLSATTNSSGGYLFPSVPPGTFVITITAKGFATSKLSAATINVAKMLRADVVLEVKSVNEIVVVEAQAAIVDTTTTVVATNVTSDNYDRLPKGRSFDSLLLMAPGTRAEPKQGGYQVDGASGSENTYNLDGAEVTNIRTGTLDNQSKIPIEWVAETTVKSSGVDAQFGGATGGVVQATTKSGSNEFHGQVSLYYSGDSMTARPRPTLRLRPTNDDIAEYFDNKQDSFQTLNPGYALGGRIVRDRLWFFSSYYPSFTDTDRTVAFTSGQTGTYNRKDRQDFWLNRLDWMPFQKMRVTGSYMYNPAKVNGLLPGRQGTDAYTTPWADLGSRSPWSIFNYQADYTVTSKFVISGYGGYNYQNYKDYGSPKDQPHFQYINSNIGLAGVPASFQGGSGSKTPNNRQTVQDIFTRNNFNIIGSWLVNAKGQHTFKFGYTMNQLANRPLASAWPNGSIRLYWNRAYPAITKPGTFRGTFGYYRVIPFVTQGDVSSSNQGLFFTDSWRVTKKLQLTLGLRSEREFVPSFSVGSNIASDPIQFSWGKKLAPRLGFAYDPSGAGKMKIYGSWGIYYDIMKYELPRGSFGGDDWKDRYYTLDTYDYNTIKPTLGDFGRTGTFPGTLIETLDRRIPSNAKDNNLIDKDLKPVRSQALDFGFEYSLSNEVVLGARYVHKQLDYTIEDVGILTPQGEQYYITNPGFGYSIDPAKFPKGYPVPATPKAQRDYDALELRAEKRFSKGYFLNASYTLSRLYGNYGGLASSDENGRTSPNVNRYFDEAWMSYDSRGSLVEGRLASDRPHTFKFAGSYDLKTKLGTTRFAPIYQLYAGTPITSEVSVQDVPVFAFGRGDAGRTPVFQQADLLFVQDFRGFTESQKFRFELNINNLFNSASVLDRSKSYTHPNDGSITFENTADIFKGYSVAKGMKDNEIRIDPQFYKANSFQGPRSLRLGIHFFF
jgi:hypothetical protein